MNGPDHIGYVDAVKIEVQQLESQTTWNLPKCDAVPEGANVLPSTWVFKRKRYPDGRVRQLKARRSAYVAISKLKELISFGAHCLVDGRTFKSNTVAAIETEEH